MYGKYLGELIEEGIVTFLKVFFASTLNFVIDLSLAKLSVLAFYVRVFRLRMHLSWLWKTAFGIMLLVTLGRPASGIPFIIFQCTPVRKSWYVMMTLL